MQKPTTAAGEATGDPWISPRDLLHFIDIAPADRFCDLILTGGVTSAVAYPGLVAVLASAYRFQAIGGSSSGAGIAAIAAAAEYRRRHGSTEGFRVMLERLQALADEDPRGETHLLHLFQPQRHHRLLFDLLKWTFAHPGKEFSAFVWALLRKSWPTLLVVAALMALWQHATAAPGDACGPVPWICAGWAAAVGWTLILTVALVLLRLWLALRRVVHSDYGVCTGLATSRETHAKIERPPLTEWLHSVIQEVAGRATDDAPLTFDDLARAPGSPRAALGAGGSNADEGISLQMFSANVSHGRPYRLPLRKGEELYFMPCELRRVLPTAVVDHMLATARPDARWKEDTGKPVEQARWRLPDKDMPVILAARMSVSFPLLFTVVRLWAPHVVRSETGKKQPNLALHRCVFMDGGLCSNFPIHLFDSALPAWPTFGASLHDVVKKRGFQGKYMGSDIGAEVFLPTDDDAGRAEWQYDFDVAPKPSGRLAGLVGAVLATVKDWNDATTARLPGVWDRVVRIRLQTGEGGLNISMPGKTILRVAHKGVIAGRLLLDRFSDADSPNGFAGGWNEHRWIRLSRLRAALKRHLEGVGWSSAPGRHAEAMAAQIVRSLEERPRQQEDKLTRAQVAALGRALDALVQAERVLNTSEPPLPEPPPPMPELHVRAPL